MNAIELPVTLPISVKPAPSSLSILNSVIGIPNVSGMSHARTV